MASTSFAVASSPSLTQLAMSPAAIRTGSGAGVADGTGVSVGAGVAVATGVSVAVGVLEAAGTVVGLDSIAAGTTRPPTLLVGGGGQAPRPMPAAGRPRWGVCTSRPGCRPRRPPARPAGGPAN